MILYACADLLFATRIRTSAQQHQLAAHACDRIEKLQQHLDARANDEPITFMVDLDLGQNALKLIAAARQRSPSATIIAFGPHVDKARLAQARDHGADHALPRSAFVRKLPTLLALNPDQ